jgi:hypothetical protein
MIHLQTGAFRQSALFTSGEDGYHTYRIPAIVATSRQWVQNVELRPYADLAATPVHPQRTALAAFVIALAVATSLVAWMLSRLPAAFAANP